MGPIDAQGAVVGEIDHRADGELGGELHGLAALDRPEGDRGVADGVEVLLVDGASVELRDELLGRGIAQSLPADGTLDQPGGRLARAETRDAEPGSQLPTRHPERDAAPLDPTPPKRRRRLGIGRSRSGQAAASD